MDEQIRQETPVAAEAAPAEVPAKPEQKKKAARHAASKTPRRKPTATAKRYDTRGARRGQYRLAAWVGLVVLLLACVGTVFLVSLGVRAIQKATDHSELQAELTDLAAPIIELKPAAFDSIDKADQNTLLLSAIYRITEKERIRQLQQKTETSLYPIDEYGRWLIPLREVNESFALLFGTTVTPTHHTIGGEGGAAYSYEYDKANACYHVPNAIPASMYTTLVDEIEVKGDTAGIRVGYALTAQLDYDNKGQLLPPSADQIETYRWLTFTETESGWILSSVSVETPSTKTPSATTTDPSNVTMPSATRSTTAPTTTATTQVTTTTTAAEDAE